MPESYIPEKFFRKNNFQRKNCSHCGSVFWTQNKEQGACGDAPCVEYSFINKKLVGNEYSLPEMRKLFLDYFENNGHAVLRRYPVIPRWRDDIYLTIASIADFQPHVTSGEVEPPANPLAISQPCIRLNDLDAVGKSGRHLSNFEMMAHHAFNTAEKHVYWIEEIVGYCHEFFTQVLHIPSEKISYKEKPWSGGGNAGAALEVLTEGLEVATLVFMDLQESEMGDIEIDGKRYTTMPLKIVDTGYGLERMVWLLKGSLTVYESIYPELINQIIESSALNFPVQSPEFSEMLACHARLSGMYDDSGTHAKVQKIVVKKLNERGYPMDFETLGKLMEPLEKVYTIADHTRTIALMLHDGIVPSNLKAGYLARLVIRRTLRLLDELESGSNIRDFVNYHLSNYDVFSSDEATIRRVLDMVESEEKKYRATVEKGTKLVGKFVRQFQKTGIVPLEKIIEFYDTYGIHPSIVEKILLEEGIEFKAPSNFYSLLAVQNLEAEKNAADKISTGEKKKGPEEQWSLSKEEEREIAFSKDTKQLYYQDEYLTEFEAHVLYIKDNVVVLDKTAFYPEGGGQAADSGTLTTGSTSVEIVNVQKSGNVIFHILNEKAPEIHVGELVQGRINWERRKSFMQHHTATHILLNAAKRVLGKHIWQAGSQLGENEARLDISHYKRVTSGELRMIEEIANKTITLALPVEKSEMKRNDAEKKFGFELYQGGVPKSNKVRVIRIIDYDIQACGGTHCRNTGNVGMIKILRSSNIQDGVERIIFSAGFQAVKRVQEMEKLLKDSSRVLSVEPAALPPTVERFFNEWKDQKKRIDELEKKFAKSVTQNLLLEAESIGDVRLVVRKLEASKDELVFIAEAMVGTPGVFLALGNDDGNLVVACSKNLVHERKSNAAALLRTAAKAMNGGGGGSPFLAMGGGSKKEGVGEALAIAQKEFKLCLEKTGTIKKTSD